MQTLTLVLFFSLFVVCIVAALVTANGTRRPTTLSNQLLPAAVIDTGVPNAIAGVPTAEAIASGLMPA